MTIDLSPYSVSEEYAWLRSSPEVLAAIEAITKSDVRDPEQSAYGVLGDFSAEQEAIDFINKQFASHSTRGVQLNWHGLLWAEHNGFAFVLKTRHRVLKHQGEKIVFECPNDLTWQRAGGTIIKEPGTIAWIDQFEPGSRLWDIGANIGSFSLYAAVVRKCEVTAFEPSADNYFALNRNILANKMDRRIRALPVAIDNRCAIADMHMRESLPGAALHVFGSDVDYMGKPFQAAYLQGAIGISIDAATEQFGLAVPHYVKIDVDGLERAVISGGLKTFANSECRSILVELDLNDEAEVSDISGLLEQCGFQRDDNVPGNVGRSHGAVMVYNMIFKR